jgi:hypothetical protein
VLPFFLLLVATPRVGSFYHHHAGGDRAHVHPEEVLFGAVAGVHTHHHPHDLLASARAAADEVKLESSDSGGTGHFHWQNPFHRIARHAAPSLSRVPTAVLVAPAAKRRFASLPALAGRARSPPVIAPLESSQT